MKPGWHTSEFWISLIGTVGALAVAAGLVSTADGAVLVDAATRAVSAVFVVIAAVKVISDYVKGRQSLKETEITMRLGIRARNEV